VAVSVTIGREDKSLLQKENVLNASTHPVQPAKGTVAIM
jgi:hypothetical protein